MKRLLTLLFSTLLLSAVLCVSASASSYDAAAEDLAAIGMFRGTEKGFELDRAPTRSEAAIMLVRLYGAEDAAKTAYEAGEISHPFTDVSEFTSPYVAWLYSNGITNGYTETTYASGQACSARNYVVFLLRALGYKDGTDFQYEQAAEFALTRGLFDLSLFSGSFLRDDLAGLTYQALACELADGSTYLLDSLVDSGAIDKTAAQPITDKIEAYHKLNSASAALLEDRLDADFSMDMDMVMTMTGTNGGQPMEESVDMALAADGGIQMVLSDPMKLGLVMDLVINMQVPDPETGVPVTVSMPMPIGMWVKDDWMYVRQGESGYKQNMNGSMEDFLTVYQDLMGQLSEMSQMSTAMSLPYINSITAEKKSGGTVYTLTYNEDAMAGLMNDLMAVVAGMLGETDSLFDMDLDLQDCTYTYLLNNKGKLKEVNADLTAVLGMDVSEDPANTMEMDMTMKAVIGMTINGSGSGVRVEYPKDLKDFPDIADLMMPAPEAAPEA